MHVVYGGAPRVLFSRFVMKNVLNEQEKHFKSLQMSK